MRIKLRDPFNSSSILEYNNKIIINKVFKQTNPKLLSNSINSKNELRKNLQLHFYMVSFCKHLVLIHNRDCSFDFHICCRNHLETCYPFHTGCFRTDYFHTGCFHTGHLHTDCFHIDCFQVGFHIDHFHIYYRTDYYRTGYYHTGYYYSHIG